MSGRRGTTLADLQPFKPAIPPVSRGNLPALAFALVAVLTVASSAGASSTAISVATVTPSPGATVKGRIRWEARVTGGEPDKVEFLVDGRLGWMERNPPFAFGGNAGTLDTRTVQDGKHVLTVRAFASDGTTATSGVTVTVTNGSPQPAPPPRGNGKTPSAKPGVFYVDGASRGGQCRDARTPPQARTLRTPWCSLDAAARAAPAGSTVIVRAGSYPELEIENVHRRPRVTFRRYGSERVVVAGIRTKNASGFRFQGFRITSYVKLSDYSANIQLVGNDLSPNGIHMKRVNGVLIERNRIHDLAPRAPDGTCGCGIWGQSWRGDNAVRNVTVRRNVITDLAGDGIHFGNGRNVLIERNTITNALKIGDGDHVDSIQIIQSSPLVIRGNYIRNNQHGLMFTDKASPGVVIENNVIAETSYGINAGDIPNARILNNTFWGNRWGAALIRDDPRDPAKPTNIVFKNNIIDRVHADREWFAEHDYNLIADGEMYGLNDRRGAARYVNAQRGDFRLARNSPGIDAGSSVDAPRRDRLGKLRRDDPRVPNRGAGTRTYHDVGSDER